LMNRSVNIDNKHLITHRDKDTGDYTNDLTIEMDSHAEHISSFFHTYIYDRQVNKGSWAIRFPGATRGSIFVNDEHIITKINLYEDTCFTKLECYKRSVLGAIDKYVGMKLVFE
jgi:hypothetical protein